MCISYRRLILGSVVALLSAVRTNYADDPKVLRSLRELRGELTGNRNIREIDAILADIEKTTRMTADYWAGMRAIEDRIIQLAAHLITDGFESNDSMYGGYSRYAGDGGVPASRWFHEPVAKDVTVIPTILAQSSIDQAGRGVNVITEVSGEEVWGDPNHPEEPAAREA